MNENFVPSNTINEEYFKIIFDTLSEGVALNKLVFDNNGQAIDYQIIAVNKSFYSTADYDKKMPVIGSLGTKLYGLGSKLVTAFWLSHKNSTQTAKSEFYSPINHRYFIISTSPFVNDMFVTSFFDISERKKDEILLQQQQEILKFALEGSGDGIWDWNIPENKVKLSKRFLELFGVPHYPAEMSFKEASVLIHPEDMDKLVKNLEDHLHKNTPYEVEHRSQLPNGEIKWFLERGMVVSRSTEGAPLRMIGTSVDITRIKTTEAQMIYNSKMSSLGEMSAGIAHEINNPLAIISTSLDLLKKESNKPEKTVSLIENIRKAIWRIERIVGGLKKFSRSSNDINFKTCSLRAILQEVAVLSESNLKRLGATLELDANTESKIFCNEIEIEQVFINLINNSADAISHLENRWVKIKIKEEYQKIVVQVIDSGKGIPIDLQQKLFDPFFTTKPVGKGTGLGLAIVKGILEQHKASIQVDNNSPNTCFEITFLKPNIAF